jgi:Flp pilus assembly protein TadG
MSMPRQMNRSRRERQGGNVLIEFALSSTLMLLLLCGIIAFSRLLNVACMAQGAAEAGVQFGALSPTNNGNLTGMQNAALANLSGYPGATATASQFCTCSIGGPQVSCPAACGGDPIQAISDNGSGLTYVQVQVTIPYQTVIAIPQLPNPTNVTEIAVARVQ